MNVVYVVYIHDRSAAGFHECIPFAFVQDDNPDGFALLDKHVSSNYGWAWKDIRRECHMNVFSEFFKGEKFDIVDVAEFEGDDHDKVIATLKQKRDFMRQRISDNEG